MDEAKRERGRPRSEEARKAILESALALVEEHGSAGLTIEGIAARSGVGRPTIYRWWKNKGEILSQAYLERAAVNPQYEVPDGGSLEKDLLYFLPRLVSNLAGSDGKVVLAILLESQLVEEFEDGFRNLMVQRWKVIESLFVRALRRGEIEEIPSTLSYETVYGPIFYRLLSRHAPLDWKFGEDLARSLVRLLVLQNTH